MNNIVPVHMRVDNYPYIPTTALPKGSNGQQVKVEAGVCWYQTSLTSSDLSKSLTYLYFNMIIYII